MRWRRLGSLVVLVVCLAPSRAPAATLEQIAAEYRDVVAGMRCREEEDYVPDFRIPHTYVAVRQARVLIMDWAVRYLDAHPGASAQDLAESLRTLKPGSGCSSLSRWWSVGAGAVQLATEDRAAYAVVANFANVGLFFVVARERDGRFALAWGGPHLSDLADRDPWGPRPPWGFGGQGRRIQSLPPAANGDARFYVCAQGWAPNGCCGGQHLSFWEWNGSGLNNLLSKSYEFNRCNDDPGWTRDDNISLDAEFLEARMKGSTRTFGTSCGDEHPRAVWRARITPDGVQDWGEQWENPDVRFIDSVLESVLHEREAADLIDPEAARELKTALSPAGSSQRDRIYLGMCWVSTYQGSESGTRIARLACDHPGEVFFFIVRRNDREYVKAVDPQVGH